MKGSFCVMQDRSRTPENRKIGIALFTNLKHSPTKAEFYFQGGNSFASWHPNAEDRAILYCTVKKEGKQYTIGTTHFTWSPHGKDNYNQRRDVVRLLKVTNKLPELILCGDFNAPRPREIYKQIIAQFKDNIPRNVKSTLDPTLFRKKGFQLVVDYCFTKGPYKVTKLKLLTGVSDHKAIVADIIRI